jgi:mannose-6-phosphate isomerase-like protein (cupin superfamily)
MPQSAIKGNIEKKTNTNKLFRKIIYTTPQQQLVVMSLKPQQEIGLERHKGHTQFIRIEQGQAKAVIENKHFILKEGDYIIIEDNHLHNIINSSKTETLKLYTLYAPPVH